MTNYQKALRFADADYQMKLEKYNTTIQERIAEKAHLEEARIAEEKRLKDEKEEAYEDLVRKFESLKRYSRNNSEEFLEIADEYLFLAKEFRTILYYKEAEIYFAKCKEEYAAAGSLAVQLQKNVFAEEQRIRQEEEQQRIRIREEKERQLREEEERQRIRIHEEEERQRIEQSKIWERNGKCRYCGSELGFFKRCKSKIFRKQN